MIVIIVPKLREPPIHVTDCNGNGSGLQSARFRDHIHCIYHPTQDHIMCLWDCNQRHGTAIESGETTLSATEQPLTAGHPALLLACNCLGKVYFPRRPFVRVSFHISIADSHRVL